MGDYSVITAILGVCVTAIGVLFAMLALFEYVRLRQLRLELEKFMVQAGRQMNLSQKASHKILASYQITDNKQRLALLKDAVTIYPQVFNGYNALGYAYLADGSTLEAIDSFKNAIHHNPDDKAGYFDLAHAFLRQGNKEFCIDYLRQAIRIDPTAKDDLPGNPLFEEISAEPSYQALFK